MVIYFESHTKGGRVEYKNIREDDRDDTQHRLNTFGIWSDRNITIDNRQVDRYWINTEIYKPSRFWKEANHFMRGYFRMKKLKTLKDKIK